MRYNVDNVWNSVLLGVELKGLLKWYADEIKCHAEKVLDGQECNGTED